MSNALNQEQFLALVRAAQSQLKLSCLRFNATAEELVARAGLKSEAAASLFKQDISSADDEVLSEIKGRDWERLLAAASIFPEDWVQDAKLNPDEFASGKFMAAAGEKPSGSSDRKVRGLIGITNAFYFLASQKYLTKHGKQSRDTTPKGVVYS